MRIVVFACIFTLISTSLTGVSAQQDDRLAPNPSEAVRISVQDLGLQGISITYRSGEPTAIPVVEAGQTWHKLSLPGYTLLRTPGKPQVPVFGELVMIPSGASFEWDITWKSASTMQGFRVYPALAPATDRYGDPEPVFGYDSLTYQTNAFWPASPVTLVDVQELRGIQLAWFDIAPVRFNPVTGELQIIDELTLTIRFEGAQSFLNYREHSADFLGSFPLLSVNAASVAQEISNWMSGPGSENLQPMSPANYIMITDSLFLEATQKLADWKRQLGYTVEVIAGTGWTYTAMKNEVHSRYQQWTPKPDYLLLIGDHDRLPAEMVINPANEIFGTDLHLVTMGGPNDYTPEMAKGRISVASASQAMTIVNKIINYEKYPPADTSFYQTGLNCAQFQDDNFDNYADRRFVHTSEDVRDYLTTKGYDIKRVYYADLTNSTPLYYNASYYSNGQSLPAALLSPSFNWNGNASHITSQINSGAFYVLHRDHGYAGGTGWHAPYYVTSSINSLNNGNKTPVVFSINCHTGEFTLPECFAERFHRHANGGAVGVVAASYYSYSGWNDGFTAGMFDAIWSNPGLIPVFGGGGIYAPMVTPHGDIRNMGRVMNQGLLRMTQTWSTSVSEARYTNRLFHYFGDPSMRIRTMIPSAIAASYPDSILCSAGQLAVSGASYPDAVATLTIAGRLIGRTTLISGSGNIPMEPFSSPYLILTISGPEHMPLTDTIWVIPTALTVNTLHQNVRCTGKAEGEIYLDISCGDAPFSIAWSHTSATTSHLTQLPSGTYHFTVTDASNASYSDSAVISEPALPLMLSGSVTDVLCYHGANGSVTVNATGGEAPYSYKWSNGQQIPTLSNLASSKYIVTVTDGAGCAVIDTFTVTQPLPLQVGGEANHDMTSTCTGAATALPTGGTPPYSYLWNDPAAQTTQTATDLCPGLVRVYVTDDHGCITIKAFTIYNTFGIEEHDHSMLVVFPNPVDGQELFVRLPDALIGKKTTLRIMNPMGQMVRQEEFTGESELIVVSDFPKTKGTYYLLITGPDDSSVITAKVIRL
ncbi:MAG: C25 family cysteine peptidase [Bacteroidales bacterium]